jgi:hypothetical protein
MEQIHTANSAVQRDLYVQREHNGRCSARKLTFDFATVVTIYCVLFMDWKAQGEEQPFDGVRFQFPQHRTLLLNITWHRSADNSGASSSPQREDHSSLPLPHNRAHLLDNKHANARICDEQESPLSSMRTAKPFVFDSYGACKGQSSAMPNKVTTHTERRPEPAALALVDRPLRNCSLRLDACDNSL